MKKLLLLLFTVILASSGMMAQKMVHGTVTDDSGEALIGASVVVKGNPSNGTITDLDGKFKMKVANDAKTLVVSFIGYTPMEVEIGPSGEVMVSLASGVQLENVVVTALGISKNEKELPYAAQVVKSEELDITSRTNFKEAIAGKISGVQLVGQAGSKLGEAGKLRLRGAISMTADSDPLYVVDGVPTDNPNAVDMNSIESVNILKGPNATALYGQRAEFGVVIITTKGAPKDGYSVEFNSSLTFDKVAYLPNFQNTYAQGYDGEGTIDTFHYKEGFHPSEWSALEGKLYYTSVNHLADESWGPKMDGREYLPWYAYSPNSPYFGKTEPLSAQPNNVKNFFETGVTKKNSIAVSRGGDGYSFRLGYTNVGQSGILPYSTFGKNSIDFKGDYDLTSKLTVGTNIHYITKKVSGDFDDGYGNQTTGSFNSWFGRNLDTRKMKELIDLKTPGGYHQSWNWWGPDIYGYGGPYEKPAFWYNPYYWMREYQDVRNTNGLLGNIYADYKFTENLSVKFTSSLNKTTFARETKFPYSLAFSAAPEKYNPWVNGFKRYNYDKLERNNSVLLGYNKNFEKFDFSAHLGGNARSNTYRRISTEMTFDDKEDGLIIPDVYLFRNAKKTPTTNTEDKFKKVKSLYGDFSIGYESMLYLTGSYRQDWSSALPAEHNGYGYPSVGLSFIFSEMINNDLLSFGKLRAGWAQVGNDVDAHRIDPIYPLSGKPYTFTSGDVNSLMYTNSQLVNPDLKPAINTSVEAGLDLKFLHNRLGLSFTYYKENRKDEIIPVSISRTTGYNTYLTNAGESQRNGIELSLNFVPVKSDFLTWDATFNFAKNTTKILSLPGDLKQMSAPTSGSNAFGFVSMRHKLNGEWGQLYGAAIKRDKAGNAILNADGSYQAAQSQFLGSVLPDFTGGFFNSFTIMKSISISAAIDFQKGGKFFSLTEFWGGYSGLLEETAVTNDKGNNVRDAVDDGGGVHVTGVSEEGKAMDVYVPAHDYFTQFYSNKLAEPFIHDASFIKLRDLGISYNLPQSLISKVGVSKMSIGFVGRNLWLISVAKDNKHGWDPSELSQTFGENGQLPGTRSYGINLNVTF